MISHGESAEGKAIWVVKGTNVVIENIAFSGVNVPGKNGAGIRHEGGKLTVRRCLFEHNEIGLLTSNDPSSELEIEGSEFRDNAVVPPQQVDPSHQIYVGRIRRFTLTASYVHRGAVGHLVKSRARENRIYYNRLTDEPEGHASYELEFPNGGMAYVVGNIIQQSARSENVFLISFGAEGYAWPESEIYLASNTLVDDLPWGGHYLHVAPGARRVEALNNLLVGRNRSTDLGTADSGGNFAVGAAEVVSVTSFDFRLRKKAAVVGLAVAPTVAQGAILTPQFEYVHPMGIQPIPMGRRSPGALQSTVP